MRICPDCNESIPRYGRHLHARGCLTEAVEAGRITPRERQVILTERRLDRITAAPIDGGLLRDVVARVTRGRDNVQVLVSPEAIKDFAKSLGIDAGAGAGETAPLQISGVPVVASEHVPPGQVFVVPLDIDPPKFVFSGLEGSMQGLADSARNANAAMQKFSFKAMPTSFVKPDWL